MTNNNTDSNVVETIFKTQEVYNECDHCQSVLSPAAYFVFVFSLLNLERREFSSN